MPREKKIEKKITKVKAAKIALKPAKAVKQEKAKNPEKIEKIAKVKVERVKVEQPKAKVKDEKKPAKLSGPQKDTGSVDFQIDNFSKKIASLAKHLKIHSHDFDSRRGLLIMVGKRRRLLNYVKKNEPERYESLTKSLKLKK